jgi:hypothetical protein
MDYNEMYKKISEMGYSLQNMGGGSSGGHGQGGQQMDKS